MQNQSSNKIVHAVSIKIKYLNIFLLFLIPKGMFLRSMRNRQFSNCIHEGLVNVCVVSNH